MQDEIKQAAQKLKNGELVIFPTETVYGLGADAANPDAVAKIYEAKNRPTDNPLIVHIADQEQIHYVVESISDLEQALMDIFWPGPLTLVFKRKSSFPAAVCAGGTTIAVRQPHDEITCQMIRLAQTPVAAPSANISGRPSPTRVEHLDPKFTQKVGYVLEGPPCKYGLESTVVKVDSGKIFILRPGAITKVDIEAKLHVPVILNQHIEEAAQQSPGLRHQHYTPKTKLILVDPLEMKDVLRNATSDHHRIAVLASVEKIELFKTESWFDDRFVAVELGRDANLAEIGARLFDCLHHLDLLGVDVGFVQSFSRDGIGAAIMDRLTRAAS